MTTKELPQAVLQEIERLMGTYPRIAMDKPMLIDLAHFSIEQSRALSGQDAPAEHPPCVCARDHGQKCTWPDCYFGNVTGHNKRKSDTELAAAQKDEKGQEK